ncbi:MAG TPA: hypothetical protein VLC52_06930 [Anaerolineae bacterium]|nr:hypothetical protein [Anaerolineae bacterium]
MSFGRAVATVVAVFCLTLAIIVVRELSSEALAVAIGVGCGVAAGIPATILLYVVLSRRNRPGRGAGSEGRQGQQGEYPPVIIVQGQAQPPSLPQQSWVTSPGEARPRSHVRLVGGEDLVPGEDQDNRG